MNIPALNFQPAFGCRDCDYGRRCPETNPSGRSNWGYDGVDKFTPSSCPPTSKSGNDNHNDCCDPDYDVACDDSPADYD